jgi:hypothetical protein
MSRSAHNTFAIGEVLDRLEKTTKEVAKSVDALRGAVDYPRLTRARESLAQALTAVDEILAGASN